MRGSLPRKTVGFKLHSQKIKKCYRFYRGSHNRVENFGKVNKKFFQVTVKLEQATVEELDEPMKIEIIPMNGMQVINIPINGKITIINPSMVPSSSETSGLENLRVLNEIPKPVDVKMETDEGEIATIEEK